MKIIRSTDSDISIDLDEVGVLEIDLAGMTACFEDGDWFDAYSIVEVNEKFFADHFPVHTKHRSIWQRGVFVDGYRVLPKYHYSSEGVTIVENDAGVVILLLTLEMPKLFGHSYPNLKRWFSLKRV